LKQFKGAIDGVKLSDFSLNKLTNVETYKERMALVEDLIMENGYSHDFFATYFSQYHDVSPSQNGYLAEETAVCKMLEIVGTYLLSAKDIESERKIEYRFWKSERDFKKSMESENVNTSSLQKNVDDDRVEVIDMFVDRKNDKNQKIVRDISLSRNDIKEINEIRYLQDAIDYLSSPRGIQSIKEKVQSLLDVGIDNEDHTARLKYIANNTERYVKLYVKALRESQLIIKKAIKRPIEFKNVLKDEGVPNKLDAFDFMEKRHVKAVLPSLNTENLMTDLGIIIYDVNKLIDETELSPKEFELVQMFRKGYTKSEATKELGVLSETTNKMMNRISLKIVKTYENKLEKYRESKRLKKI
jgi:hypothetical protein